MSNRSALGIIVVTVGIVIAEQAVGASPEACVFDAFDGVEAEICFRDSDKAFLESAPRAQPGVRSAKKAGIKGMLKSPDYSAPYANPGTSGFIVAKFGTGIVRGPALLDVYVFEAGREKEPIAAFISKNGKSWKFAGCMSDGGPWIRFPTTIGPESDWPYLKIAAAGASEECQATGALTPRRKPALDKGKPVRSAGPQIDAVGAKVCSITFRTGGLAESDAPFFDEERWHIRPRQARMLGPVVDLLNKANAPYIKVTGYADKRGSREAAKSLAIRRAEAVADYLVQNTPLRRADVASAGRGAFDGTDFKAGGTTRRLEIAIYPKREQGVAQSCARI